MTVFHIIDRPQTMVALVACIIVDQHLLVGSIGRYKVDICRISAGQFETVIALVPKAVQTPRSGNAHIK